MTVPYPSLFDDIRNNHGFVDLRGHPDLASAIPEALQSTALKGLLTELAHSSSPLLTLGCDLGTHEEKKRNVRFVAGGYFQLLSASYMDREPEDYRILARAIAKFTRIRASNYKWSLRFVLTFVDLKLDHCNELIPSLWTWFFATSNAPEEALASREILIETLHSALTDKSTVARIEKHNRT